MSKRQIFIKLIISIVIAIPIGFLLAVLMTPLLWRLEEIIPVELAGHSGPADWVFLTVAALTAAAIFILLLILEKKSKKFS